MSVDELTNTVLTGDASQHLFSSSGIWTVSHRGPPTSTPPYPTIVVFQGIRSAVSRKRAKAASSVQSSSMGVGQLNFGGVTDDDAGAEQPCFSAPSVEGGSVMARLAQGEGAGVMRG
jgi:hypothetical protein